MDINLNEARNIITRLEKTVRELEEKRDNIASVLIAPGEDYHDYINDTVDNISERIIDYNIAINTIHEIIMMANVGEKITFNGKEMTIAAALNLVKEEMAYLIEKRDMDGLEKGRYEFLGTSDLTLNNIRYEVFADVEEYEGDEDFLKARVTAKWKIFQRSRELSLERIMLRRKPD